MDIIGDPLLYKKDDPAYKVIEKLESLKLEDAILYYNFPLYRGDLPEDLIKAHLLLLTPRHGAICLRCLESERNLTSLEIENQEDVYLNIEKRLKSRKELRNKRELRVPFSMYVVNGKNESDNEIDYIDINSLKELLDKIESEIHEVIPRELFRLMQCCIEGTDKIVIKKQRVIIENENATKSSVLCAIQNREGTFDREQKKTALITIEGPQRIRGLAGSGKTIVLAMKAAQFHLSHPNAEILYTFYTKALYDTIRRLIERFYRDFSDNQEPNWKKIHILHGWGGFELPGVYSRACSMNGIHPVTFSEARNMVPDQPFSYACKSLVENHSIMPAYDLILIDEGQDFPKYFYQLCYHLSKERRVVWAYDDFQNIFDVELQDEKETYGKNKDGNFRIDFSQQKSPYQDIALQTCYRTPRLILTAAFSLGLGIYNKDQVLQRLEDNAHWKSLGFKVEEGDSSEGCQMVISRPEENSPMTLNEYFKDDALKVFSFKNMTEEIKFVTDQIQEDINGQHLRPDDICVICLDEKFVKSYFDSLGRALIERGIMTFNLFNTSNSNRSFFHENEVTLSSVNKAKGNEAGMIYIMGVDRIFNNPNNVIARNKLFTAMTRAKGWVTLTGTGELASLRDEIDSLKRNQWKLIFKQPSKESTRTIKNLSEKEDDDFRSVQLVVDEYKRKGMSNEEIIKKLNLNV